ncbi:MAG: response regulator [Gemmatimonadetes bacterium]|nr:response regulator [Gemmatimonadota bacterium]
MTDEPRASILAVDDRPENLFALEAILEPLGHTLVRANSGEEALRQVLQQDFACILLDVQMPGMNGFETAQLIKSRERSRLTPIIFLTAISKDEAFIFEGYSVGAVDYMFKPFNPDILRSKVAVFIDLYLKTQQLQEQERRLRDSERREMELRHQGELQASEARMAEIVSSAMEAIITFDGAGRITLFNAAAERMFGVSRAEAAGKPVHQFFEPDFDSESLDAICAEGREDGEKEGPAPTPRSRALTGTRPGGESFPVEASLSCLQLEEERVFTVIARDVSERKRAEEALRQQAVSLAQTSEQLKQLNEQLQARQRELEAAMSARSRFYASMSHELRTPINAILGYSSLLLDNIYGELNEQQSRGIERANKAARHLLELVNDILDLSKIEAGKVDLEIQTATFPDVIQDLFITVRPLADEHGSELALDPCPDPVTVVTDARRVRQILLNLLSNAIKFGEGKPITVLCRARDEGGVMVSVIDRGRGIPEEDRDKIFDEFVQLQQPDPQQGTGLGLPISRRLAELLEGSLVVESRVGEGSTFTLSLPAKVQPPPAMREDPFESAQAAASAAAAAAEAGADALDALDAVTDSPAESADEAADEAEAAEGAEA